MLGLNRPTSPIERTGPLPEISEPVDLCWPDGRLKPSSVGWSRRPLHRANLRGRGRMKRWEYWGVMSPEVFIGITVSDLDYAGLHAVYVRSADGFEARRSALVPFSKVAFPQAIGSEPVRVRAKSLAIDFEPDADGARLAVQAQGVAASMRVNRPEGHEALAVVVPWSSRRFQYTVKENTLPAQGRVEAEGRNWELGADTWACVDHGRGSWPYSIAWNWGSGSGVASGRVIGIQVGGKWTDGTGSVENAITVDGIVSYVGSQLAWEYDARDWMRPWRVHDRRSGRVDLTFTPEGVRAERINLGVLANDTHQAFGTWSGFMCDSAYNRVDCDGIRGWAEEVRNRW